MFGAPGILAGTTMLCLEADALERRQHSSITIHKQESATQSRHHLRYNILGAAKSSDNARSGSAWKSHAVAISLQGVNLSKPCPRAAAHRKQLIMLHVDRRIQKRTVGNEEKCRCREHDHDYC
jgi:hypothetical protein